jgi:peptidoglycan/xylan/chitin deacetylase (PgdA/CDA1 family)
VRRLLKLPLVAGRALLGRETPGVSFLIYHSVGGGTNLELDTPFAVFEKQARHLLARGSVVPYEDAVARLEQGSGVQRDLQVLTFDDGYESTARLAFPLLRDLGLALTVFVSTGLVDGDRTALASWPHRQRLPMMTWEDLGRMLESGLVTLGAHTHAHTDLDRLDASRTAEELDRSGDLFRRRLGIVPRHFAYPRARWGQAAEQAVRARYATAVVGGGRQAVPLGFDPWRIPRVPVRRSDGWRFFRAKVAGYLVDEERVYAALHAEAECIRERGRR